jgi:hypothetical protein
MKAAVATPLIFRGLPRLVEGLIPLPFDEVALESILSLSVKLSKSDAKPNPLDLQVVNVGETATMLRCVLPESTPPGTYEGTVLIGARQYPAAIDVEAFPSLVISPDSLSVRAAPGTDAVVNLTITNNGNIPCEMPRTHRLGLLDVKAMGLGADFFLDDKAKGSRELVNLFAEELSRSYSGQVDLILEEGSGSLAPGEFRPLRIVIRIPEEMEKGRIYAGKWVVLREGHDIEVQVSDEERHKESGYE